MSQQYPQFIWHNGTIKPWAEATTHVMAHALHYGSSVFEGIRSYATPKGQAIFPSLEEQDANKTAVAMGDTAFFTGPTKKSYAVPALKAGSYIFTCQVHPSTMKGTLEVK